MKIVTAISMLVLVYILVALPGIAQESNEVSIADNLSTASGSNISVPIMLENSTGVASISIKLNYNASVVNVTDATAGDFTAFFGFDNTNAANGWITISTYITGQNLTGDVNIANVTLEAIGNPGDSSSLNLTILSMSDQYGKGVNGTTDNGTFIVDTTVFDTGSPLNPYPSIMGNHTGTIKPNHTVIATKLYTYPCTGTGGHTEYAKIGNLTWNATATWEGYAGDWHNITFDKTVVLLANKTYNYTIRTGSYPQIIHEQNYTTLDGSFINCTKVADANGKEYNNWIPAIRLD